jgi:CRP/FNR family transcriptional regulator
MYVTIPTEFANAKPAPQLLRATKAPAQKLLKAKSHLFYEGDRVDWLYQIKSGVVRLTRLLSDGRRQVIAFGYPDDIIGFPSNGDHHTDCEALTETHLQPYRRTHLESGKADPELHTALLQAALREISAMQDHFMMLGRKSAAEKLASFLCVLSERVGEDLGEYKQFKLPMSRSDIADFLGLTTETVSRTFTLLRKSKIIAIYNIHTIVVLRPTALMGLSVGDQA